MEILGYGSGLSQNEPELKTELCRKAWEMLRAFGDETSHEIEIEAENHELDIDDKTEIYESTETGYINYGDMEEYSVVIDQYPFMNGKMCSDIGFVVLHLGRQDNYHVVADEQQIVFRQEAHPYGPEILIGDNDQLETVAGLEQLIEVGTFLEYIKTIAWKDFVSDPFSSINTYPQSDLLRSLNSMLFSEEDNL
jgi:hypothetical protein